MKCLWSAVQVDDQDDSNREEDSRDPNGKRLAKLQYICTKINNTVTI